MKISEFKYRKKFLLNILARLCIEYGVESPKLIINKFNNEELRTSLHGYYSDFGCGYIHLNFEKVATNLAEACRTLRHEFFHHLQYHYGLCDKWTKSGQEDKKRLEAMARRFEDNKPITKITPKNQLLLSNF